MRNRHHLFLSIILAICMITVGCGNKLQPSSSTDQSAFTWQIAINEQEVKPSLKTIGHVTQYDGTVEEIPYENIPQDGKVYLILNLSITKNQPGGIAFKWEDLSVMDDKGNRYPRHKNDSFLSDHGYERIAGTDLKLGDNSGWICFEVPWQATQEALTLSHKSVEGDNSMIIEQDRS